jgi:RNA recognition motif-containing protein
MKGKIVNKKLFVGNLEYSITDENLQELFSSEGKVIYSKVIRSLEGNSKGFGFVEMETEEEAAKAIEKYNESTFRDRTIFVNEAKPQSNKSFSGSRPWNNYNKGPKDDLNSKLKSIRIMKKKTRR